MKHRLLFPVLLSGILVLSACTPVDTTGISAESSKKPTGNQNSAITVTEYGDFQCPACGAAYPQVVEPLLQKYGSQIRYEFKQFPLSMHQYGMLAAQASECAADEGKFWEFVDIDYKNQPQLSKDTLYKWADQLGLNKDRFDRCLRSGIKKKTVLADYDEGVKLGVQGTPTFFVNGKKVESSVDAIGAAISAASSGAMQRL